MSQQAYWFDYRIEWEAGQHTCYHIVLDPATLTMASASLEPHPTWTRLGYKQCQCCPLHSDTNPYCPIAVNITDLVEGFKNILSYKNCEVVCETMDRTYSKRTSAMECLTSVFGIVMATSDCPVMNFLKPMARFHLPFASVEETTARATSLFLLGQYFEYKKGQVNGFDFDGLEKKYAQVRLVNEGLLARIRSLGNRDADKNAIITLHSISQFLSVEIGHSLGTIAHLFKRDGDA